MSWASASIPARAISVGVIIVSLGVTPWNNLDPVSVTKLFLVTTVVSILLFCRALIPKTFVSNKSIFEKSIKTGIFFLFLSLLLRLQFPSERVFGINGRNLGSLFFISLFLLLLFANQVLKLENAKLLIVSIKTSSVLVAIYFAIQRAGLDRAQWVDAYGGVPSSTLGNPNFVSSFVAIGFASTLPILLSFQSKNIWRLVIAAFSLLEIYVINESRSAQGFIICGFAIFTFCFVKMLNWMSSYQIRVNRFSISTLILIFVGSLFLFRMSSNSLSTNVTLQARLDYWRAAISMIIDSPFYGQGFDYFGESYFLFRSTSAAIRSPGLFTDSAHNYFLDVGAFSGLFVLTCFLTPMIIVFIQVFRVCFLLQTNHTQFKPPSPWIFGAILAWFGFILQALISPISHSLIYVGVVLTAILHTSLHSQKVKAAAGNNLSIRNSSFMTRKLKQEVVRLKNSSFDIMLRVACVISSLALLILGAQPMITDAKFRDAIEQGNGDKLLQIALNQPKSFARMEIAAQVFVQNERSDLALRLVRDMVRENPENIRGWRLLLATSNQSVEKSLARKRILELDPKNPKLAEELARTP